MEANQTRTGVIASVFPVPSEKPTASNMLRQQAWQVQGRFGGVSVASDYQSHVRPPRAVLLWTIVADIKPVSLPSGKTL